ncbi:MAG: right-handed parallel beta-helix repeat-containing protein [Nitrospira sp.]|nr:right-handed parallel beta-helix repeat-containing protein [Nitrospira sp.]
MIRFRRAIGACVLASALVQAVAVHAATYYVATTGNDGNLGTEIQPWRTVAYAVSAMIAGDTTYVRAGTYREGIIRFSKSGMQVAPIKLLNYPRESPVIDCVDKTQFHRIILEHASRFQNPMGWITIEGFEIRNCYDGIKLHNAHDLTLRRNWIHDNMFQGILGNGTRILIDRNRINHNGRFAACATTPFVCNLDHGIYLNGTAIMITNNLIYDNLGYGIQANGTVSYDSTKHAGSAYALSYDWVIANNTIAYQVNCAAIVVWGSTLRNLRVENNIFYENSVKGASSAVQGIDFVWMTSTEITIKNNLAFSSGSGGMTFLGSGANEWVHYTQSGNIVNVSDPGFINAPATLPALPNFALTSRSPAIDKGVSLTTTSIAFNGITRPQGLAYDLGAYEYHEDGDVRSSDGQ